MKLAIVNIGNSKGVRIPTALLKQCELTDEAEVEIKDGNLIFSAPGNKVMDDFCELSEMPDWRVQNMLKKIDNVVLAIAMINAKNEVLNKIKENMSERAYKILFDLSQVLKKKKAQELIIDLAQRQCVNVAT